MYKTFFTNIGILFLKLLALLPFPALFILSDIFYFILYYLVGYRKKVVFENLRNSFPKKPEKELTRLAKKFYQHFCDLTLETVKAIRMKETDFEQRYKVMEIEKVNRFYEAGKSVVILTMHYANWEWGSCFPLYNKHTGLAVYKRLHNPKFDEFMNKTRSVFGAELTEISNILRRVLIARKNNEPVSIWLAGDQTPPHFHDWWFVFLNQEAIFYPGPAVLSKRFNYPVFFQKTKKIARGRYEVSFELLFENPQKKSEAEIIKTYIRKMEEEIKTQPEYYLWSHRRWKHVRPENVELM